MIDHVDDDNNNHVKEGHHHVDEDDQREQRICNRRLLFTESAIITTIGMSYIHIKRRHYLHIFSQNGNMIRKLERFFSCFKQF